MTRGRVDLWRATRNEQAQPARRSPYGERRPGSSRRVGDLLRDLEHLLPRQDRRREEEERTVGELPGDEPGPRLTLNLNRCGFDGLFSV
jgi:hypothetical protein